MQLLEFSVAHGAFSFYCLWNCWKLAGAVEAEVNFAFGAANRIRLLYTCRKRHKVLIN